MSADNYLYVRKLPNGMYDVTHRFASLYYRDEHPNGNPKQDSWICGDERGWYIRFHEEKIYPTYEEAYAQVPDVPDDWFSDDVPPNTTQFTTVESAVMAAHRLIRSLEVVEYGVIVQEGLL